MICFFTSPTVLETFRTGKRESNQQIKTETGEFIMPFKLFLKYWTALLTELSRYCYILERFRTEAWGNGLVRKTIR